VTSAQLPLGPDGPQPPNTTDDAASSAALPVPAGWPDPPTPEAYHGVFGAIIEKLAPHTEADRATRGRTLRVSYAYWRID